MSGWTARTIGEFIGIALAVALVAPLMRIAFWFAAGYVVTLTVIFVWLAFRDKGEGP